MRFAPEQQTLSISAVERETGLSKDTLRIWERRYGFPQPIRDRNGDRLYPYTQVNRLRMIKRLIDAGFRPSKIIPCADCQLQALTEACGEPAPLPDKKPELDRLVTLIAERQGQELKRLLNHHLLRVGLKQFVIETIAPLNAMIREKRACGELELFDERLYTELAQGVLRNAISVVQFTAQPPRVLLTSFPNEHRAIGLMMVEAILCGESVDVISLGTQLPINTIAAAAAAYQTDIVVLAFSGASPANLVSQGLKDLRHTLPDTTDIWAGGPGIAQVQRPPKQVNILRSLSAVEQAIFEWRATRGKDLCGKLMA